MASDRRAQPRDPLGELEAGTVIGDVVSDIDDRLDAGRARIFQRLLRC